jgi:hypothetical protein
MKKQMFEIERLEMQVVREIQEAMVQPQPHMYYYYTNHGTLTKYPNNGIGAVPSPPPAVLRPSGGRNHSPLWNPIHGLALNMTAVSGLNSQATPSSLNTSALNLS